MEAEQCGFHTCDVIDAVECDYVVTDTTNKSLHKKGGKGGKTEEEFQRLMTLPTKGRMMNIVTLCGAVYSRSMESFDFNISSTDPSLGISKSTQTPSSQ